MLRRYRDRTDGLDNGVCELTFAGIRRNLTVLMYGFNDPSSNVGAVHFGRTGEGIYNRRPVPISLTSSFTGRRAS